MNSIGGIDLSFFSSGKNNTLLDYGSGNGKYSVFFIKKKFKVTAIDLDPQSKTMILDQLSDDEKNSFNFHALNAETQSLDSCDRQFDYIICREVLEHIKNFDSVIKSFSQLLKPNGLLVISVPSFLPEKYFALWDKNWLKKCGHVNVFKEKDINSCAKKYNFDLLKIGKHSFRRTIYWSLMTPFKVNHEMGKISNYHKLSKYAQFFSDCVCYFKFVEKIGNFALPKSKVFYLKKNANNRS